MAIAAYSYSVDDVRKWIDKVAIVAYSYSVDDFRKRMDKVAIAALVLRQ